MSAKCAAIAVNTEILRRAIIDTLISRQALMLPILRRLFIDFDATPLVSLLTFSPTLTRYTLISIG